MKQAGHHTLHDFRRFVGAGASEIYPNFLNENRRYNQHIAGKQRVKTNVKFVRRLLADGLENGLVDDSGRLFHALTIKHLWTDGQGTRPALSLPEVLTRVFRLIADKLLLTQETLLAKSLHVDRRDNGFRQNGAGILHDHVE